MIKILFFGDIFGRPGRNAVKQFIEKNKVSLGVDLVIANSDNMTSGKGPNLKTYSEMIEAGVDVLTSGDHIWDQKEAIDLVEGKNYRIMRPANYPKTCPGKGSVEVEVKGRKVVISSLLGRVWTAEGLDSPFVVADEIIKDNKDKVIIFDFHAEATSEKIAFGHYVCGRASCVFGTHTHVQTADEKIISDTAFISDSGSCGPYDSVIGVVKGQSIKRFTTGMPMTFDVADGPVQINALLVEVDEKTAKAKSISRIQEIIV